ncbi:ferredoxin [Streptomyces zhihengii]|uniref:Ferredoxin n=1 Tax=Streptomyces zhihengii TaxID=1818004 RepID=A0ABS2UMX9_9ACTN|nr:ferredoxin [Streptomyces zhihengii]MBM9618713.1 ferredoxin [Streptomyces zhihengii]
MTWHIEVDQRACMGAGLCNGTLPDRFRLVGGKAEPTETGIEPDEDVLDAADYCPYRAIRITDMATGETLAAAD